MTDMDVIAMGVHVLDLHVRPVEGIPERSDGQIVGEIVISAAGTAGGTATILRKLGAGGRSFGAVGSDPLGDTLLSLLEDAGIDTTSTSEVRSSSGARRRRRCSRTHDRMGGDLGGHARAR